jgi:transcriptional regulator with XRE-family HTH domain
MIAKRQRISSIHDVRYRRFVEKLVALRVSSGLSQKELACSLGMLQPDISKIERFERRLDVLEAVDWLRAVNGDDLALLVNVLHRAQGEDE